LLPFSVIPAKAGIHPTAVRASDKWIPAFAGMTMGKAQQFTHGEGP
jgi:hypothetical protein